MRLATHGSRLWMRKRGRELREMLEQQIQELQAGDSVVIDLDGVEVFDYSFANEFFGRAMLNLPSQYPGRFLLVERLGELTREDLESALESLGLVMIERKGGRLELLGKVHPADRQTFEAIVQSGGSVTAAKLRDRLGVNLTAMNERLSKLTSLGLVRREKVASPAGREQYRYWGPR